MDRIRATLAQRIGNTRQSFLHSTYFRVIFAHLIWNIRLYSVALYYIGVVNIVNVKYSGQCSGQYNGQYICQLIDYYSGCVVVNVEVSA